MKIKFILGAMLVVGAVSYSAEATDPVAQEVINEVRNIEAEYQALMQKEAERKEEFIQEKANLEQEVKELKEKQLKEDKQFLEYIQNEISLSQKLDSSINVDLEQTHEDFILIPFDDVFFSNKYYDTINKTISMLKDLEIEFFNLALSASEPLSKIDLSMPIV